MDPSHMLQQVEHRTAPMPRGPWIMTQIWHELLFAHWPVSPALLRSLIPPALTLDTYDGQAWVGIVPFHMSFVRPRGVPPVPTLSRFPELNVRTYVLVDDKPGVFFFSLDAGNPIAVEIARDIFHLPYFNAAMRYIHLDGAIHYQSRRTDPRGARAEFTGIYRPIAPVSFAARNTLAYWFTERYCLYTIVKANRVYCADIHHIQWPLQAAELEISHNTMATAHNIQLPDTPPLLHYSHRQEVLVWPLRRVR